MSEINTGVYPSGTKGQSAPIVIKDGSTIFFGGETARGNNTLLNRVNGLGFNKEKHGGSPTLAATSGSYQYSSEPLHTRMTEVIDGRDFAIITTGRYIIIGNTPFIAGTTSTILNASKRTDMPRSINFNESRRTALFVTAGWNLFTGKFITTPTTENTDFTTPMGTDDEARSNPYTLPGELAYTETTGDGKIPKQDSYKTRN